MPVSFGGQPRDALRTIAADSAAAGDDIGRGIALAVNLGVDTPLPGGGRTAERLEILATVGATDLTAARVVEPHLDALAILAEAAADGLDVDLAALGAYDSASWGVFAAEGPGVRVDATQSDAHWSLTGTKPWCSLGGRLSHALITAHTDAGRRLFAISLRDAGIEVPADQWQARGLTHVTSGPIVLHRVPAVPVGAAGWYLHRPGFAWGGIGVAAVWWGGAIGLGRALHRRCQAAADQQILQMHLGAVDAALFATGTTLQAAADAIDGGSATDPNVLASRVRVVAHDAAELVLNRVGHALGPAPLALDDRHARRVADLTLYLRQHHAERDQAALGTSLLSANGAPW